MHNKVKETVKINLKIEYENKYQCWLTNLAAALIMLIAMLIRLRKQNIVTKIIVPNKRQTPATTLYKMCAGIFWKILASG